MHVPCLPEGVPTIWNNRTRQGRDAETWFGRNGAGNIMARFASNQSAHARRLLDRISEVFVASGNVYESYDMGGNLGGDPGSNYLEHCAGYSWAVTEGLFGVGKAKGAPVALPDGSLGVGLLRASHLDGRRTRPG